MTATHEVRIQGQLFKLKSQASGDYVRELARHVNDIMDQVARESHVASVERTAIMTALKIADEHLQLKRAMAQQTESANEKISGLIAASDLLLKG
ncbi:MAG: cell division protein ZapA [Magnetococcales bacterium]|nr:cell division protein ZapA [Magnetococcales bacterium]